MFQFILTAMPIRKRPCTLRSLRHASMLQLLEDAPALRVFSSCSTLADAFPCVFPLGGRSVHISPLSGAPLYTTRGGTATTMRKMPEDAICHQCKLVAISCEVLRGLSPTASSNSSPGAALADNRQHGQPPPLVRTGARKDGKSYEGRQDCNGDTERSQASS